MKADCEQIAVDIPNAFTPNGDGTNDLSSIVGGPVATFQMSIYNRWGELLYESSDPEEGWDGSFKGEAAPVGVFTYVVEYSLEPGGEVHLLKGSFNLIR